MGRLGCYTTARVTAGRIERLERHAGRLRRDAGRLGLALPERTAIEAIALETVAAGLGRGDGIVRIEWSIDRSYRESDPVDAVVSPRAIKPRLAASVRSLGVDPEIWRAITARALHPGPGLRDGTKSLGVAAWDEAGAEREAAGVDEALLFDGAGRLVEGSRTNLVVVTGEGFYLTPARGLGPVEGLGLEVARESVPAIRETLGIDRREIARARELIAVNAVRGAVAIVALDGRPIADGRPGALAQRLRSVFGRD